VEYQKLDLGELKALAKKGDEKAQRNLAEFTSKNLISRTKNSRGHQYLF
jgi:hypothetical protein